jgi:hypothetical protein
MLPYSVVDTPIGFNADLDPPFYLNADPDLGSQTNADHCGSESGSWSDCRHKYVVDENVHVRYLGNSNRS